MHTIHSLLTTRHSELQSSGCSKHLCPSILNDEMKSTPGRAFRGEQDSAGRQRDFAGRGTSVSPKTKSNSTHKTMPSQSQPFMMKWRVHQGAHSEESKTLLEDRETLLEEVLLCPLKQRATANTKQCLLKVSPLWWNEEYTRERIQRRARLCWKTEKLKRYFCVPPKQGATEQKENNAFSKSVCNDEMKGTPEMEENSYPLIRMEEPQGHVWRCRSWRSWTSRLCIWRRSRSRSEQVDFW